MAIHFADGPEHYAVQKAGTPVAQHQTLDPKQQCTINDLKDGWNTLPSSKNSAAKSLLDWYNAKGFLTFKQWEYAHSLALGVKLPAPAPKPYNAAALKNEYAGPVGPTKYGVSAPSYGNMQSTADVPDFMFGVPDFTVGMEAELFEIEAMRKLLVENPTLKIDPFSAPLKLHAFLNVVQLHKKLGPAMKDNTGANESAYLKCKDAAAVAKEAQHAAGALVTLGDEDYNKWNAALAEKYDLDPKGTLDGTTSPFPPNHVGVIASTLDEEDFLAPLEPGQAAPSKKVEATTHVNPITGMAVQTTAKKKPVFSFTKKLLKSA